MITISRTAHLVHIYIIYWYFHQQWSVLDWYNICCISQLLAGYIRHVRFFHQSIILPINCSGIIIMMIIHLTLYSLNLIWFLCFYNIFHVPHSHQNVLGGGCFGHPLGIFTEDWWGLRHITNVISLQRYQFHNSNDSKGRIYCISFMGGIYAVIFM